MDSGGWEQGGSYLIFQEAISDWATWKGGSEKMFEMRDE